MTKDYRDIIADLIEKEQGIIGAMAVKKANEVDGLTVNDDGSVEQMSGMGKDVLSELVDKYESMVGEAIGSVLRKQKEENELPDMPDNVKKYFSD